MDIIDTAQDRTIEITEQALKRATQSSRQPVTQTIIWVDMAHGKHEQTIVGTIYDRLSYLEQHRIDECPFAFAYYAGEEWFISGNDAALRKELHERTRGKKRL